MDRNFKRKKTVLTLSHVKYMQRCSACQAALWFPRQEGFSEVFGNQRCHEYGEHLIPPSTQVPSFLLLFLSDNSYIWGGNGDEDSHWGGSYAEADTDATCLHGTDARLPSLIPYFPLALSLSSLPFQVLSAALHFPTSLTVCLCISFSTSLSAATLSDSLSSPVSFSLFPIRHLSQQSMPFHPGEGTNGIPAESIEAAANKGCSVMLIPSPRTAAWTPKSEDIANAIWPLIRKNSSSCVALNWPCVTWHIPKVVLASSHTDVRHRARRIWHLQEWCTNQLSSSVF